LFSSHGPLHDTAPLRYFRIRRNAVQAGLRRPEAV
jgi:hypothetical protein